MEPLYTFTSHIQGKNATVSVYPDRIEWFREGSKIARYTAITLSLGLAALAGKQEETRVVPLKQVSTVTVKRDGLVNSKVMLMTSSGVLEFRVSHAEAAKVKDVLTRAMAAA